MYVREDINVFKSIPYVRISYAILYFCNMKKLDNTLHGRERQREIELFQWNLRDVIIRTSIESATFREIHSRIRRR